MIRGIHHIGVHVHDMDRMVAFYRDAFGFELVDNGFEWSNDEFIDRIVDVPKSAARGCMLKAGTCYMELFQYSAPPPDSSTPLNPYDKGYTHFCVDVTEIEQEVERLKGLGMTFREPAPIDVGHVKSLYGRDPEGNVIEIQETTAVCVFPLNQLPPPPTRK